jgi:hypothetical protein
MSGEVVFEGDEFSRGTSGGTMTIVPRSGVVDFMMRRRIVRSERQARLVAAGIAVFTLALAVTSATWAARSLRLPPPKPYAAMSTGERESLPLRQRLYLDRVEAARAEADAQKFQERFRAPGTQNEI